MDMELCTMTKKRNMWVIFAMEKEKERGHTILEMADIGKETGLKMFKMGKENILMNLENNAFVLKKHHTGMEFNALIVLKDHIMMDKINVWFAPLMLLIGQE